MPSPLHIVVYRTRHSLVYGYCLHVTDFLGRWHCCTVIGHLLHWLKLFVMIGQQLNIVDCDFYLGNFFLLISLYDCVCVLVVLMLDRVHSMLLQLIVIWLIVIQSTALFIWLLLLPRRLLQQIQVSYIRSINIQELAYAAVASFSLTRWQQFSAWNDITPPFWKSKILTLPIDAYLSEEHSCQISSQSNLKWQSLRLFWRANPTIKNKNNKMSDMRSVPDLTCRLLLDSCWPNTLNRFSAYSLTILLLLVFYNLDWQLISSSSCWGDL